MELLLYMALVVGLMGTLIWGAVDSRKQRFASNAFATALVLAGIIAVGPLTVYNAAADLLTSGLGLAVPMAGEPSPTSEAGTMAPAEQAVDTSPAPTDSGIDVPWGLVGAIAGAVAGAIVIGAVLAWALPALRRRHATARAGRLAAAARVAARQRLFDGIRARHTAVEAAYAEFLLDLFAILERPALNDVTVTQTAKFLDAYARAADLRPTACPADDGVLTTYEVAVRAAERTWVGADSHARRIGTGLLGAAERKRVNRAVSLLTVARGGATPSERQAYYEQAMRLLDGVLIVPAQAMEALAIESRAALALPA